MNYVDGNAAAGELNRIFAMDITTAEGQCGNCGAKRLFAETHLYLQCPGLVARCPLCGHVLLRLANIQERVFLDLSGVTYLIFDMTRQSNATS
jgi:DNA-directed RNA polymerase subunit RPC12/RpoP